MKTLIFWILGIIALLLIPLALTSIPLKETKYCTDPLCYCDSRGKEKRFCYCRDKNETEWVEIFKYKAIKGCELR